VNPELGQDLSLFHLVLHASLPVQVVMVLLLGASIMSWWFIFIKMFSLKRALRVTDRFEREFWGGGDMNAIYQRVAGEREGAGEMERIFEAGFREFMKLRHQAGCRSMSSSTVPAARCARRISASSMVSNRTCPFWRRSARSRPTSACSARCGAS